MIQAQYYTVCQQVSSHPSAPNPASIICLGCLFGCSAGWGCQREAMKLERSGKDLWLVAHPYSMFITQDPAHSTHHPVPSTHYPACSHHPGCIAQDPGPSTQHPAPSTHCPASSTWYEPSMGTSPFVITGSFGSAISPIS